MPTLEDYLIKTDDFSKILLNDQFYNQAEAQGNVAQQLLGISDTVMQRYYAAAMKMLAEYRWQDARDAFVFLTFLNPSVYNFWIGLAIAEQHMSHFDAALMAYQMAMLVYPQHPTAYANAFQCSMAIGKKEEAMHFLSKAVEACGEHPEFAELKSKLITLQKNLQPK